MPARCEGRDAPTLYHHFLLGPESNAGAELKARCHCSCSLLSVPGKFKLDEIIFKHNYNKVRFFASD